MGGDRFAAADGVDAFVGLALDADAIDVDAERRGDVRAHRVDVRPRASALRAMTVDVDVADLEALLARRSRRRARSRSRLDASFQRGSVSGKWRPMSPRHGRAENRVGHRVADDVGVRMAERAAVGRNRHAAEDERPALRPADAGRSRCRRGRSRRRGAGASAGRARSLRRRAQILRRRDLDVRRLALDEADGDARPARPAPLRRSPRSPARQRQRVAQHVAPERLRRLRQKIVSRGSVSRTNASGVSRRRRRICRASPCRAPAAPRPRRRTRPPPRSSARSDRRSRTAAPHRESR